MFGMMGVPIIKTMIKIKGKTMELEALEYFVDGLYQYVGLELPDNFNPDEEAVRVMSVLHKMVVEGK
jgi:hypothetical protein